MPFLVEICLELWVVAQIVGSLFDLLLTPPSHCVWHLLSQVLFHPNWSQTVAMLWIHYCFPPSLDGCWVVCCHVVLFEAAGFAFRKLRVSAEKVLPPASRWATMIL
jgi:hypothetical protein